jgi:hypothetical protein
MVIIVNVIRFNMLFKVFIIVIQLYMEFVCSLAANL